MIFCMSKHGIIGDTDLIEIICNEHKIKNKKFIKIHMIMPHLNHNAVKVIYLNGKEEKIDNILFRGTVWFKDLVDKRTLLYVK